MTFAMTLALLMSMIVAGPASGVPTTTLSISEPKYGTSPIYVSPETLFSLTSSDLGTPVTDIWYKWSTYNYTKYEGSFNAVLYLSSTSGAPPLPIDLEGLQTLYYNATGESSKSQQVYVDLYNPVTTASIVGANYSSSSDTYITSDTGIKLSASDPDSGVADTFYKVNDGAYTAYVTPIKLTGNGLKTISYYSEDNVGNKEDEKTITIYLDSEAPIVIISPGNPKISNAGILYLDPSTYISITVTDISGVSTTSYRVDSGTWTVFTGPFMLPVEGQHTIYAQATDMLGHQSTETILTAVVDNTPPIAFVIGHDSDNIQIEQGGYIELGCSDSGANGSAISYSTDGGLNWNTYTSPLCFVEDTELMYYATDALGNSGTENTIHITIAGAGRPWTFYLGIALIIGAVVYLVYSFLPRGEKPEAGEQPEKKKEKAKEEDIEPGPKKKMRNL